MNRRYLLRFAAILQCLVSLSAQETSSAGVVRFPEGKSSWTVEFQYRNLPEAGGNRPAAAHPMRANVVCDGLIRRDTVVWSDGKTEEIWRIGGRVIVEDSLNHEIVMLPSDFPLPCGPLDGTMFLWIENAHQLQEPVHYGEKECYHYQYRQPAGRLEQAPDNARSATTSLQAWIDTKTFLPVALDDGAALYKFSFQPPQTGVLTVPKEILAEIDRYEKAMKLVPQRAK